MPAARDHRTLLAPRAVALVGLSRRPEERRIHLVLVQFVDLSRQVGTRADVGAGRTPLTSVKYLADSLSSNSAIVTNASNETTNWQMLMIPGLSPTHGAAIPPPRMKKIIAIYSQRTKPRP